MVRADSHDKVSLTPSTWIGLIGLIITLAGAIGTPVMMIQGRVTTVEVRQDSMQHQLEAQDQRSVAARNEILGAIKDLRTELKAK